MSRVFRCALLTPSLTRAGAELQTVILANWFSKQGHAVHLIVCGGKQDLLPKVEKKVSVTNLFRTRKLDVRPILKIRKLINEHDIEVLICSMQFMGLFGFLATALSSRKPVLITSLHTTVNKGLKEELQDRLLYRHILKKNSGLVFVCRAQLAHWKSKFPELSDKARVIHNGIEHKTIRQSELKDLGYRFRLKLGIPSEAYVVCCVARLRPEKGHSVLLRAFAKLPADSYLILAGDGPCRENLLRQAEKLRILERVHFLGDLDSVVDVFSASEVMVLTSTAVETFSMAVLEAMSNSVPIIASKIGGIAEAVRHGKDGYLYDGRDERELCEFLRHGYGHRNKLRIMGTRGASRARMLFTEEKMGQAYENLVAQLVGQSEQRRL